MEILSFDEQKYRDAEIRMFSTGKCRIGDTILRALELLEVPEDKVEEELKKKVPHNRTAFDMLSDITMHQCNKKHIIVDDNPGKGIVGLYCESCGIKWRNPLPELKACAVWYPEIMEILRTIELRKEFANRLSN